MLIGHVDATTLEDIRSRLVGLFNPDYRAHVRGDYASREDSESFYRNASGVLGGKSTIIDRMKEAKADRALLKDSMRLTKRPAEVRYLS